MTSEHRRWRLPLLALVVIALTLRLGVAMDQGLDRPAEDGTDQKEYDTYAWNLAQGRGYRGMSPDMADQDHLTAYRAPGPSLVWAGLYVLAGHRPAVVRVMHCVVGALGVLLVFAIGRRSFGPRVGFWAAAIWTIMPTALIFTGDLLSEPLGTFWLLAHVLALLRFADRPSVKGGVLAGVLLGIAILTRPNFVVLVPLEVVWALWQFRSSRRVQALAIGVPLLALLTLAPWTIRNWVRFRAFIPLSTGGGSALLQGNNRIVVTEPSRFGYAFWDAELPEYRTALMTASNEYRRDQLAKQFAVEWLLSNPEDWPFLAQAKLRRAFTPFLQPNSPRLYRLAMLLGWGPLLVLFLATAGPTLFHFLRSGHPGWILHVTILHHALVSVLFFASARYRQPVEPLCIILAATALDSGTRRLRDAWRAARLARSGP